ncbi:MAG: 50S ribosomal protein L11 methyltransferase [Patescibacteria group bacterium]
MSIVIAFISLFMACILISLTSLLFTRVPYVNTPRGYCEKILDNIDVSGLAVYDLGCGDGYFLSQCAKKGAKKCVGYELSPMAYLSASKKILTRPISIKFGDFFKANISEADMIYIYLVKTVLAKLSPKLKSEVKPGARIITVGSPLIDWEPEKVISLHGDYSAYIYKSN